MKRALFVLLLVLLIPAVALAAVYVYKAIFSCQVTVEPGVPGLAVAPTQLDFGAMAVGDWSRSEMLTIQNIGTETITAFYFESNGPEGLTLYVTTPPFMPLTPGSEVTFPISLKADDVPPGVYDIEITVIGVK